MRCPSRQLTCARYFARLPRKIRLLACHQVSAKGRTRSACRRSTRSFLADPRSSPRPLRPVSRRRRRLLCFRSSNISRSSVSAQTRPSSDQHSSCPLVASRLAPSSSSTCDFSSRVGKLRMGEERRESLGSGQCTGSTLCLSAFNSRDPRARNLEIDDERRARQPIVEKAKLVQQFRVKLPWAINSLKMIEQLFIRSCRCRFFV